MSLAAFTEFVENIPLVDHHVHASFQDDGSEVRFLNALNEGNPEPLRDPAQSYDSQIGFSIRRWCAELLDLPRHAEPGEYWRRREELGEAEVARRMTRAAGVSDWLLDTGFKSTEYLDTAQFAAASGGTAHEVVRLESVAEALIQSDAKPGDYAETFAARLSDLARTAVGAKSILAYRGGFDHDLSRPATDAVNEAAQRWRGSIDDGGGTRLTDLTLIAHGIHTALELGLPLQFHVGFGDRELDLAKANPLHLMGLLRDAESRKTPILLLHCYPFEREGGYLAQAFENVYLDVGLALNFTGARSASLIARSLELAPFSKILFSSDAYGPAELHYLGARLWRTGAAQVIGNWIASDEWSEAEARKVVQLIARDNARRVYSLP